jgi:hypothetical protein
MTVPGSEAIEKHTKYLLYARKRGANYIQAMNSLMAIPELGSK